jgi:HAE1 family hydrophobic/amphiphilic exporter-1
MAVAVIGGLFSSTALSLVLVPVVYEVVDMFEKWITPLFSHMITPKGPDDDLPIRDDEELIGHAP